MSQPPFSYVETEASTGQETVNVTFGYLARGHVNVSIDGEVVPQQDLSWVSPSQIELPEPLVGGETVRVYRTTPAQEPAVIFTAGPLDHRDLNRTAMQQLYVVQEAYDSAIITANLANSLIQNLSEVVELHDDMESFRDEVVGIDANLSAAVSAAEGYRDAAEAAATTATGALASIEGAVDATAADAVSTAADRVQTGLDRIAAAASAAAAEGSETAIASAEDAVEEAAAVIENYVEAIQSLGYLIDWGSITDTPGGLPTDYGTIT